MSDNEKIGDAVNCWNEIRGKKLVDALNKRGFQAQYFCSEKELKEYLHDLIPHKATIGLGGSVTVRELKLEQELKSAERRVYDHWQEGLTREEIFSVRRKHLECDVFITSSNAVTTDGRLLNTDGSGNRVAAMIFGPQKIIVVVGTNKIVKNIEEGLQRIKRIAPLNFMRGNEMNYKDNPIKSPCLNDGICKDCRPPHRQCRVTTIIEGVPKVSPDYHVLVVGKDLGY